LLTVCEPAGCIRPDNERTREKHFPRRDSKLPVRSEVCSPNVPKKSFLRSCPIIRESEQADVSREWPPRKMQHGQRNIFSYQRLSSEIFIQPFGRFDCHASQLRVMAEDETPESHRNEERKQASPVTTQSHVELPRVGGRRENKPRRRAEPSWKGGNSELCKVYAILFPCASWKKKLCCV
jgi:hypothetical protein